MSNKNTLLFNDWLNSARDRVKSASVKVAADEEALTGIKDPNEQGVVAPPAHHDGNDRAKLQLPANKSNFGDADKGHNLMGETSPDGVGQGHYITPINGDAKDKAATTPTAPLDKIANMLRESVIALQSAAEPVAEPVAEPAAEPAAEPVAPVKEAAHEFDMPSDLTQNDDIMRKLASIGAMMIGCEEGAQAVAEVLERRCGEEEANALICAAREQAIKMASAVEADTAAPKPTEEEIFAKKASVCAEAHAAWFNYFQSEIEKRAYAQGAVDGEQAAQAMEAGAAPEIPGTAEEGMSDEDVLQVIQEMIQAGEISPEEAEALLASTAQDGEVTMDEVVAYLEQAVASGEISQEEAAAMLQSITQGGAPAAAAETPVSPEVAEGVAKAASVIGALFN